LFYCGQNKSVRENKMSDPNAPAPRGFLNWWQGLILAVSSAILGVVAAVYAKGDMSVSGVSGASWAMVLLRFIPHFLLLFGILADAFTYEGVYWTGTAVGVGSVFVTPLLDTVALGATNLISKLVGKAPPPPPPSAGGFLAGMAKMRGGAEYQGCSLMAETGPAGSTQTLVVTTSILAYYIFDLIFNLSALDAAGAIAAGLLLFGGQVASISGCFSGSVAWPATVAGIYGIIIGLFWYSIIAAWGPQFLPSSVIGGASGGGAMGGAGRNGPGGPGGAGGPGGGGLAEGSGIPGRQKRCVGS
jgi:hypothetical protein